MTDDAWQSARQRLAESLAAKKPAAAEFEKLKREPPSGLVGEGNLKKQIAVSEVASIQALSEVIEAGAGELADQMSMLDGSVNDFRTTVASSAKNTIRATGELDEHLSAAVRRLAEASDTTGNRLAKWTMWLAIATGVLAAATIALVLVEAVKR